VVFAQYVTIYCDSNTEFIYSVFWFRCFLGFRPVFYVNYRCSTILKRSVKVSRFRSDPFWRVVNSNKSPWNDLVMTSNSQLACILTYVIFLTEGGYGLQILLYVETVKGCIPPLSFRTCYPWSEIDSILGDGSISVSALISCSWSIPQIFIWKSCVILCSYSNYVDAITVFRNIAPCSLIAVHGRYIRH
jgi:hypothetical protein